MEQFSLARGKEKAMRTMPYNLNGSTSAVLSSALSTSAALSTLFDKNSVALSTGKFVNASTDNSTLYCKDVRLSERAAGLNSVVDGLSNIVSLLSTSGKTIDSLKDFLAQAKALGNSALDNENYLSPIVGKGLKVKDSTPLSKLPHMQTGDKIILRTGKADEMESSVDMTRDTTLDDLGLNIGEKFNIKVGDNDWISLEITDLDVKVTDFLGQITEKLGADKFSAEISDGRLTIKTLDRSPIILQDDADATAAKAMGFDLSTTHIIESQADWTVKNLADEIGKIDNMTAFVNDDGYLEITSIYGDSLSIADLKGRMGDSFGITGVSDDSDNKHKTYAERYNELLKQIDSLVDDASFNGLNLLQGDTVRAVFSEDGFDYRTIRGVKLDSASLGLTPAAGDWQNDEDVTAILEQIEHAENVLKAAADKFERASYTVQSRSSFMESLSVTFDNGALSLTGANLEQISVEQIAINTQKQLINQVVGLTLEASGSILSLF